VAEQSASEIMGDTGTRGLDAATGQSYEHETHHGSPASWVAVSIIIVGFIVGAISLPIGPTWWLFWIGAAIVVVGGIFGLSVHILDEWY
jgi:hypothetical protein